MKSKPVVYFFQKPVHRGVQKDRVKYAPLQDIDVMTSLKEEKISGGAPAKPSWLYTFAGRLVHLIPAINIRKIPEDHIRADYVYTWSDIPRNTKKPFIIELENAYNETFYEPFALHLYKPIVRRLLLSKKCQKISCWSNACKLSVAAELGEKVGKKCVVVYPAMGNQKLREKKTKTINFLFISLNLQNKGGRELLKAFHGTSNPNIRLHTIGDAPADLVAKYKNDKRITISGPIPREKLFNDIYPESDVLFLPTFYDSFGWVTLEALSFGLGIVATNVYALPEVCIHNKNGYLIPLPKAKPVVYGSSSFVDVTRENPKKWLYKYTHDKEISEELTKELKKAIAAAIKDHAKWKLASQKLFKSTFSEEAHRRQFLKLMK